MPRALLTDLLFLDQELGGLIDDLKSGKLDSQTYRARTQVIDQLIEELMGRYFTGQLDGVKLGTVLGQLTCVDLKLSYASSAIENGSAGRPSDVRPGVDITPLIEGARRCAETLGDAVEQPLRRAVLHFKKQLQDVVDAARSGVSDEQLLPRLKGLQESKRIMADHFLTEVVHGVKVSETFTQLDCLRSALWSALAYVIPSVNAEQMAAILEAGKKCKQKLEGEFHKAAQRHPFPPRHLKHTTARPHKCAPTRVVHRAGDNAADVSHCTLTASIRIDPAPDAGTGPGGEVFPGQSLQTRPIAVNPPGATSCGYRLVDPQTGARPGAPFPNQQLQIVFEGLLRQGEWVLSYRVLNYAQSGQDLPPKIWRVTITCLFPSPPAASSPCQAHSVLSDLDGSSAHTDAIDFSCRLASTQFKLSVPSRYRIDYAQNPHKLGANGDHYNCAFANTHGAQDTIDCSGGSPPASTLFLPIDTTPAPTRGLPVQLSITLANGRTVTLTTRSQ